MKFRRADTKFGAQTITISVSESGGGVVEEARSINILHETLSAEALARVSHSGFLLNELYQLKKMRVGSARLRGFSTLSDWGRVVMVV